MKKVIYKGLVALLAASCCMTACQKEEDTIRLAADFENSAQPQESKTLLYQNHVVWVDGDKVKVNDVEYTVDATSGTVEVPVSAKGYAALYAGSATSASLNGVGGNCTGGSVKIPNQQSYSKNYKYKIQQLKAPMVARLDDDEGRLQFRNLYSIIKIKVKNPHIGKKFTVNSIDVTASHTNLAGTMNFSLSGGTSPKDSGSITLSPITTNGSKSVRLYNINQSIPSGEDAEFFIYCAPVENDTLTVVVTGAPAGYGTTYNLAFQKAGSSTSGVTIARNDLARTTVDMADVWPRIDGKFAVSDTKQVYFACGNLQYNLSSGDWRFAPMGTMAYTMVPANFNFNNPVAYMMEPTGNVGNNYTNFISNYPANEGWMSLFGWGTSGEGGCLPTLTSTNAADYYQADSYSGPAAPRMACTNYDWGVKNAIINPLAENPSIPDPAGTWRMLTTEEWEYLLNNRTNQWGHNYVNVVMDNGTSMPGFLIYPQGVTEKPDCVTSDLLWFGRNMANITQKEFEDLLYFVGCAFLPMYSERTGTTVSILDDNECHYWTASDSTAEWALTLSLKTELPATAGRTAYNSGEPNEYRDYKLGHVMFPKSRGFAVRLVKDVQ